MADTAPLVIVGTGLAGYNLAKEFRKLDNQRPMLLVSADDGRFYSKPLLSTGFAKGKEADELAMQDANAMAAQLGAEVLTGVSVSAIDPAARILTLGDRQQAYSDLVLALGAEVRALPWREQLGERLLSINDLADYGRFRAALTGRKKVLIIGAGLIGCEFANDLSLGGFEVTVVATDPWVMPQLLPEPVAAALQRRLEALGVTFHLGCGIRELAASENALLTLLDDGSEVQADQGLSAIGLAPRTDLAAAAGLSVGRGVRVDAQLRSSDPHIYALGDCAEVAGLNLMYVMPLMTSARALAKTLAGTPTAVSYPAMPIMVKTPACPLVVAPPLAGVSGEWQISGEGEDLRAVFIDQTGQLQGFALTGAAVSEKALLTRELPAWLS
ncbi:NAD(P)/FAD-dependent oxidoreductase [Pseudomonas abyssi]|uniref:Pyridine nucleotide-disulfide oxidoreductase n=1 Tax=Pseudomonas abyssi TaxID=170540 RepID=A0A395QYU9_9PSED|nr:FAD-dependent oxidoreductase [Halopseudomonas gallaeciensis]RGP53011.1 pyridine nucleotide-disulfide oxidoreductase [Halopseudomonas gallaeciensis]